MSTKLYVGNLPFRISEEELLSLFQQAGAVQAASVIRDKFSGRSRGFGFVEMGSPEAAQRAVEMLNGHTLDQRALVVDAARPQTPRSSRPGGPGRGPRREFGGYPPRGGDRGPAA